jgi:hypothetical protein
MTINLRRQYSLFFKFRALLPCVVKYIKGSNLDSATKYFTDVFCSISQSIQAE